jgi:uncharacterized protein YuzE
MKITYDKSSDVFAIYFSHQVPDDTIPLESSRVYMSVDLLKRPVSFEILEASKMLPKRLLSEHIHKNLPTQV